MKNRLSKVLAACGVASRRGAEALIFEGRVLVNGKKVVLAQTLVDLDQDTIVVDGKAIGACEKKVTYLLNKPKNTHCTHKRPHKKARIVTDLFAHLPYRLFTVGRLDKETTGLLIVTNDGHFANRVIHPSSGIEKEYCVIVEETLTENDLKSIAEGAIVEERFVKPLRITKLGPKSFSVVIIEGKKREVRCFVKKARLTLLSLCRTRIGGLHLPTTIAEGTFRKLKPLEKKALFVCR